MTLIDTLVEEPALDRASLRKAMGRFATGVTVITTQCVRGKCEGVTANSFSTVSLDPPLVLWSLSRTSGSFAGFMSAGHFAVNVLGAGQIALSRHFATRSADKLAGIAHEAGLGGCPLLPDAIAQFECRTETRLDGGDHTIFIGRVLRARYGDGEPLIFSSGAYHRTAELTAAQ